MNRSTIALLVGALAGCAPADSSGRSLAVFGDGRVVGTLRGGDMREVSGMISSSRHPGHFWLHNDSGAEAELILIDSSGAEQARVPIPGARNRDWEDISRRGDTLLIAELGDNQAQHDTVYVYAVLEPTTVSNAPRPVLATYPMQFPDGARDAEALLVDQRSGDWFIFTKREDRSRAYRYPAPQRADTLVVLERLDVDLPFRLAVSAAMAPDGMEFVIKSYDAIYLWRRADGEPVSAALRRMPASQPYVPERQGEAIAYTLDGSAYLTTSEIELENPQLLIRYARLAPRSR